MKVIEEYLRIVERVYIVSSTIDLDKGYDHIKELIKKKYKQRLRAAARYFSGQVTVCRYHLKDNKNRSRSLEVAIGRIGERELAVKVVARVPLLPNPTFRLLVDPKT